MKSQGKYYREYTEREIIGHDISGTKIKPEH